MSQIVSVYLFTTAVHWRARLWVKDHPGMRGWVAVKAWDASESVTLFHIEIHSIPGDALGIFGEWPLGRICWKRNLMEFVENLKKDSLHLQSFFDFFDTLHPRILYSLFIIIFLSSKDIS